MYLQCFSGLDSTQNKSCTPDRSTRPLISLSSSPTSPHSSHSGSLRPGEQARLIPALGFGALPSDIPLPDALISIKSLLDSRLHETSSAHLIQISAHPTTFLFPLPTLLPFPLVFFCFPVLIRCIVYCVSASLKHKLY